MLKHKSGEFDFSGGRIEWKESIFGALKRELREELGYSLKEKPDLFDIWNYISKDGKRHNVMIYFIHQLDRKPKFSSPEKLKTLWLTKRELLSKNIIKNKKFLNKIFNWKKSKR